MASRKRGLAGERTEPALVRRNTRILNGKRMDTKEHAHEHLLRRLKLPQWYGRNLDALSDCLGDIGQPTTILFRNTQPLCESLGEYGVRLIDVFTRAAQDNEQITLILRERF